LRIASIHKIESIVRPATVLVPVISKSLSDIEHLCRNYSVAGGSTIASDLIENNNGAMVHYSDDDHFKRILLYTLTGDESPGIWKEKTAKLAVHHKDRFESTVILDISLSLDSLNEEYHHSFIHSLLGGIYTGQYNLGSFKSNTALISGRVNEILVFHPSLQDAQHKDLYNQARYLGEASHEIMDLVNAPANHKSVKRIAEWSVASAKKYGYHTEVLEKEDLQKLGMHALLGVNRGSEESACCIISRYSPKSDSALTKVGLVGKGVTFDTGGLSIKGHKNMHYMKSDMGGAAAVLGATEVAARLQLPVEITTVVPLTDNSVDSKSLKPSDVIQSYSGKTIEIIDTDAEGRLILADGLAYCIKNFDPDYLIDVATLTGSVVRALGSEAAGLMTPNDELAETLFQAGIKSGERLWRLPLWKEYGAMMESSIADIKNLGDKPVAGAITAGKFLEFFTNNHPNWAHLDIAGMAFGSTPIHSSYNATGFGIHLLVQWLLDTINKTTHEQ
jgi:leucyl aminopeptidase